MPLQEDVSLLPCFLTTTELRRTAGEWSWRPRFSSGLLDNLAWRAASREALRTEDCLRAFESIFPPPLRVPLTSTPWTSTCRPRRIRQEGDHQLAVCHPTHQVLHLLKEPILYSHYQPFGHIAGVHHRFPFVFFPITGLQIPVELNRTLSAHTA